MPLLFAYGLALDRAATAARCPSSRCLGTARLARHRFVIVRAGGASVQRDPRSEVWGALWDLALSDLPAFERGEDTAALHYTRVTQPVSGEAGIRRALVHVARDGAPGVPRPGYLQALLAVARDGGLPPAYVASLGRWGGATAGAVPVAAAAPLVRPTRRSPLDPPKPAGGGDGWRWRP